MAKLNNIFKILNVTKDEVKIVPHPTRPQFRFIVRKKTNGVIATIDRNNVIVSYPTKVKFIKEMWEITRSAENYADFWWKYNRDIGELRRLGEIPKNKPKVFWYQWTLEDIDRIGKDYVDSIKYSDFYEKVERINK